MYVKAQDGHFVHCPRCDSTDIRYSDGVAFVDLVMWLRHKHALRCRACRNRFHAPTDEAANFIWISKD